MYDYKKLQELGWMLATAAGTTLLQVLIDFDPAKVSDWKLWAISLGAGAVRAIAAAGLVWLGRARAS